MIAFFQSKTILSNLERQPIQKFLILIKNTDAGIGGTNATVWCIPHYLNNIY